MRAIHSAAPHSLLAFPFVLFFFLDLFFMSCHIISCSYIHTYIHTYHTRPSIAVLHLISFLIAHVVITPLPAHLSFPSSRPPHHCCTRMPPPLSHVVIAWYVMLCYPSPVSLCLFSCCYPQYVPAFLSCITSELSCIVLTSPPLQAYILHTYIT